MTAEAGVVNMGEHALDLCTIIRTHPEEEKMSTC